MASALREVTNAASRGDHLEKTDTIDHGRSAKEGDADTVSRSEACLEALTRKENVGGGSSASSKRAAGNVRLYSRRRTQAAGASAPAAKAVGSRDGRRENRKVDKEENAESAADAGQEAVDGQSQKTVVFKNSRFRRNGAGASDASTTKNTGKSMTKELQSFFSDVRAYFSKVDNFKLSVEDEDEGGRVEEEEEEEEDDVALTFSGGSRLRADASSDSSRRERAGEWVAGLPSVAEEAQQVHNTREPGKLSSRAGVSSVSRRRSSMGMSRRLSLVLQAKDGDRDTPLRRKLSFAAAPSTPSRLSFGNIVASTDDVKVHRQSHDGADAQCSFEDSRPSEAAGPPPPQLLEIPEEGEDETDAVEGVAAAGEEVDESAVGMSGLRLLMKACEQDSVISSFSELPTLADFMSSFSSSVSSASPDASGASVRKIGEGTFGEAFKGVEDGSVFKIVPIEGSKIVNGELQKGAEDIIPEVVVAKALSSLRTRSMTSSEITGAFVELRGSAVCRGRYPSCLLDAWCEWDEENTSENDNPDMFEDDQHYIVFVFADGGRDLERFSIHSFEEAKSILMQTVVALAVAEEAYRFEHRDLHWGNVLVSRQNTSVESSSSSSAGGRPSHEYWPSYRPSLTQRCRLNGVDIDLICHGVSVTLIDFTLSRINNGPDCAFCDLSLDPELFKGPTGDAQADCYRRMKKLTKNDWSRHCPKTNVVWVNYLAEVMMSMKDVRMSAEQRHEMKSFKKRVNGYAKAGEIVWDEFFNGMWRTGA